MMNSIRQFLNNDTVENVAPFIIAIALVCALFYCLFFWGSFDQAHYEDETRIEIENFKTDPTRLNAQKVLDMYHGCRQQRNKWDCELLFANSEFITLLMTTNHIDMFVQGGFDRIDSSEFKRLMKLYNGKLGRGYILKAQAFGETGDYKNTMIALRTAFGSGSEVSAARHMQTIFQYFGCTDDIAVWSEFVAADESTKRSEWLSSGGNYPAQQARLSNEVIIENRIQLRKGKFFEPTDYCPLSQFLK